MAQEDSIKDVKAFVLFIVVPIFYYINYTSGNWIFGLIGSIGVWGIIYSILRGSIIWNIFSIILAFIPFYILNKSLVQDFIKTTSIIVILLLIIVLIIYYFNNRNSYYW